MGKGVWLHYKVYRKSMATSDRCSPRRKYPTLWKAKIYDGKWALKPCLVTATYSSIVAHGR
jgi:hypothetical protein